MMDDDDIRKVAQILQQWNPLGSRAADIPDLVGYEVEAIDIIGNLDILRGSPERIIRDTMNSAFSLDLSTAECIPATKQILAVLKKSK